MAAAVRAADYLRSVERPRDPARWGNKGPNDFVTACDRASEELITEVLQKGEPGSTVLGEEFSPEVERKGLVWIVDPIDGTTNFIHGLPAFAVSIAAEIDGVLEAGVVMDVERNRIYHARRGGGAWLDEERIGVSRITNPAHALIGTGFPFKDLAELDEYQRQFARVAAHTSGIRRAGSAALDLADVAAGRFEGFWEPRLSAWDIAAGVLIIREAGGVATDYDGRDLGVGHGPVIAGNPAIHRWLMETLRDGT